jgi:hypothetical protein
MQARQELAVAPPVWGEEESHLWASLSLMFELFEWPELPAAEVDWLALGAVENRLSLAVSSVEIEVAELASPCLW